tara:strand:+ start:1376 stop:1519 length:144 start_codon:yes stop_codon:yes gene_type:complete
MAKKTNIEEAIEEEVIEEEVVEEEAPEEVAEASTPAVKINASSNAYD